MPNTNDIPAAESAPGLGSVYEIESVAFEGPKEPDRGYTVKGSYLKGAHKSDALIEIFKDGALVRYFLFPAYKVWNIPAHFSDIVDGELKNSPAGYEIAASDGITNAVLIGPNEVGLLTLTPTPNQGLPRS